MHPEVPEADLTKAPQLTLLGYETLGLARADLPDGSNSAISPTLIKESNPSIQKIVGSSAVTKSKPTTDVAMVFDAC